jgi:guanine deaminase
MPGLINAHMHGHGALAKGMMADHWTLELFLNSSPALGGNRTLDDKYLCGLLNAVEMVRKGSTACYDLFFEFPLPTLEGVTALGNAYAEVGVRATIAPMIADRNLYQALPGLLEAIPDEFRPALEQFKLAARGATIAACEEICRNWPFDRDRIRPALAPTIPLHCSDDFLCDCSNLARKYDLQLQTHLSESKGQAVLGLRKYGRSLTAHLDKCGLIGPNFTGAHAIWIDDDDLSRVADRGGALVHNPMSNMRFGSGLARLRPMVEKGITVAIGTDGVNTSDSLNMFEATRLASLISRVQDTDSHKWLRGDEVFAMATEGTARALGFGDSIGRIAPGAKADIVFLDLDYIHYVPLGDALTQVVFTENGAAVDSVMIGGHMILDQGRMTTIDEEKLRARVEAAAERLHGANAERRAFALKLEEFVGQFCIGLCRSPFYLDRYAAN